MRFVEQALAAAVSHDGIDSSFRPADYARPSIPAQHPATGRMRGAVSREVARTLLKTAGPLAVRRSFLTRDEAPLQDSARVRYAVRRAECLPRLERNEVEIARLELASIADDVISVRARKANSGISYCIVDEYPEVRAVYRLAIAASVTPLALHEMVELIDQSRVVGKDGTAHRLAFADLVFNEIDGAVVPEDLAFFVNVTSAFYPGLARVFDRLREICVASLR